MRGLMFRKRLNILKSKGERFYEEKIIMYTFNIMYVSWHTSR